MGNRARRCSLKKKRNAWESIHTTIVTTATELLHHAYEVTDLAADQALVLLLLPLLLLTCESV